MDVHRVAASTQAPNEGPSSKNGHTVQCVYLSTATANELLSGRSSVTFQIYLRRRDTIGVSAYAVRIGGALCFQPWRGRERNKSSHTSDWPSRRHVKVGVVRRGRDGRTGLVWVRFACMGKEAGGWEGMWEGNAPARPARRPGGSYCQRPGAYVCPYPPGRSVRTRPCKQGLLPIRTAEGVPALYNVPTWRPSSFLPCCAPSD